MKLILGVILLMLGLSVAFGGIVIWAKWGGWSTSSGWGLVGIGGLVVGLLGVGVGGMFWRAGGGVHVGNSRWHRRLDRLERWSGE